MYGFYFREKIFENGSQWQREKNALKRLQRSLTLLADISLIQRIRDSFAGELPLDLVSLMLSISLYSEFYFDADDNQKGEIFDTKLDWSFVQQKIIEIKEYEENFQFYEIDCKPPKYTMKIFTKNFITVKSLLKIYAN